MSAERSDADGATSLCSDDSEGHPTPGNHGEMALTARGGQDRPGQVGADRAGLACRALPSRSIADSVISVPQRATAASDRAVPWRGMSDKPG